MGRHPSKRTLMLFYDGELGPATADEVGAHASRCGRCRAWMADLASVGAVVRGEVIPTLAPSRTTRRRAGTWEPRPLLERILPALAAVAAVATVMTLVVANDPANEDVAVGADGVVETVPLPSLTIPPGVTSGSGQPGPDAAGGTGSTGASNSTGTGTALPPPAPNVAAPADVATAPVVVAVLVPGGQTGAGEPVVHAVAVALAEANAAGGVNGAPLQLVAADADDPAAAAALADRKVDAVVGGYGADKDAWQILTDRGVPWFGPADVSPNAPPASRVVAVEVSHPTAGRLLGQALAARGARKVVALTGSSAERGLADGLAGSLGVSSLTLDDDESCAGALNAAAVARPEVLALALDPAGVAECLDDLREIGGRYPIRQIVVPSTGADHALAHAPDGFGVATALGAPGPDDQGKGMARFRASTGIPRNYRAVVSYAATELAVASLRRNPSDPIAGFQTGGVYRSDLLTLNPAASPPNVAVQVVDLAPTAAFSPPPSPNSGSVEP